MTAKRKATPKETSGKTRFWTAGRVSYLTLALLAFGFVFFAGGQVPYGLASVTALVLPVGFVYAFLLSRRLRVLHRLSTSVCVRGTEVSYHVMVHNHGLLATPDVRIVLSCPRLFPPGGMERSDVLLPLGTANNEMNLKPAHRGEYHFEIAEAGVSDLFRLFRLPCRKPKTLTLLSLPVVREPLDLFRTRINEVSRKEQSRQSTDELAVDARSYRPGDPVRRVHWNLTARSNELMVRRFEDQSKHRVACLLDLRPCDASLDCEDELIEQCLSVLRYTLNHGMPTTLLFAEGKEPKAFTGESQNAFRPMYDCLARVPFDARTPLSALVAYRGEAYHLIVFCIGAVDEQLLRNIPADCCADICEIDDGSPIPVRHSTERFHFIRQTV